MKSNITLKLNFGDAFDQNRKKIIDSCKKDVKICSSDGKSRCFHSALLKYIPTKPEPLLKTRIFEELEKNGLNVLHDLVYLGSSEIHSNDLLDILLHD